MRTLALCGPLLLLLVTARAADTPLPGTEPLNQSGDLSAQMVAGIDKFLMRQIDSAVTNRESFWHRDFASAQGYQRSVETNRIRLRERIGAVDPRVATPAMELVGSIESPSRVAETARYTVDAVRWPVFPGVYGEGLLVRPKGRITARIVVLPDADQTPEQILGLAPAVPADRQFARRLAENGCMMIIPVLISRADTYSGNARFGRFTNQPHREWIYRQAFELGRHIIGYEVQKVLAAVDWLETQDNAAPLGVAGYAEGGLVGFYAAAFDPRIKAMLVSGYFDSRQRVWEEPIYRNVFGLLSEFGDAEIASLIAPRRLIVEQSDSPTVKGPPTPRQGRGGAAPGKINSPDLSAVEAEVNRANAILQPLKSSVSLIYGNEGRSVGPGSDAALLGLFEALGAPVTRLVDSEQAIADGRARFDPEERQHRQFDQLVEHTQRLLRQSEEVRNKVVWNKVRDASGTNYNPAVLREVFWNEVIGKFPKSELPLHPRSRVVHDEPKWTGYDVMLDVWPDVFAWGVLLLPKDLKQGERRPVVVCQHGLEGVPEDTIAQDPKASGYGPYKGFASRLAERGFVVFAPHNPYRGHDAFRVLQRKANPLGKTLFSVITGQHDRILDWLSEQPFVDPKRIGFYGLSYGGKTAMRVPALLDRYALSICSADFNEWIRKNATTESTYSYLFTIEYEMPEFNLGQTFNYAEMACLIAPRPFMVERGHDDGVAPDEWVAYEYSKIRRFYDKLGIGNRTEIEFFNGPHTINGQGTFAFLHRHLQWPLPLEGH
jgi:dienelactone hydrolase